MYSTDFVPAVSTLRPAFNNAIDKMMNVPMTYINTLRPMVVS